MIESGDTPVPYDNKFYERHGNSVEEISVAIDLKNLFDRFK